MIFVFGSNLAGKHCSGAADCAMRYENANYGQAIGLQGTSYAIPTMDAQIEPLSLHEIKSHVNDFLDYARISRNTQFFVTRIGCGRAGYKDEEIAPMFKKAPANCVLPECWVEILNEVKP